jgi:hypothetical protein
MNSKTRRKPAEQNQANEAPPAPKRRFRIVKLEESRLRIEKLEERINPSASGGSHVTGGGGIY